MLWWMFVSNVYCGCVFFITVPLLTTQIPLTLVVWQLNYIKSNQIIKSNYQDNNLQLNTSKILEIIIDFRRKQNPNPPVHVNSHPITSTNSFKFLGTYICNNLKWYINADHIIKKGQQRLYFLSQLKTFRVHKHLLVRFYQSIIESIITSSITVWYGNTDSHSLHRIQRIVSKASRIINSLLPSIHSIYLQRTSKRAKKIISDHSHPANHLFQCLPSGSASGHLPQNPPTLKTVSSPQQ